METTSFEAQLAAAEQARVEALVDLWLAVMVHFNEVPPAVQAAWQDANVALNQQLRLIRSQARGNLAR